MMQCVAMGAPGGVTSADDVSGRRSLGSSRASAAITARSAQSGFRAGVSQVIPFGSRMRYWLDAGADVHRYCSAARVLFKWR